jgi:hypothetical protein
MRSVKFGIHFLAEAPMISLRFHHWTSLVWLATAGLATAEPLAQPTNEVVLTVTGEIGNTNAPEGAVFDLEMLEALGTVEFETTTIWSEGPQVFRGAPLIRLVEVLEAGGAVIHAVALNEYTVEIPLSDVVDGGPILAFEQNGVRLSVRDKGPLWVVYPYDSKPDYQSELIYVRSIWQLAQMEFR